MALVDLTIEADAVSMTGCDYAVELGDTKQLLHYTDGVWRFAHVCDRPGRGVVRIAPLLGLAHVVDAQLSVGLVSVTPSILCPDCGLHGWVTDSVWVGA